MADPVRRGAQGPWSSGRRGHIRRRSAFAISVPGHTPGSTAYVLRTPKGPVLLTSDACHTRWGWEHDVEPGSFTADRPANLKSLLLFKNLAGSHPALDVRLGHQY
jgi:N-acyl homoserine lactone hydrolase